MIKIENKNCIQKKIGFCTGCRVLQLVEREAENKTANERMALARRIGQALCPEDAEMQISERKPSRLWLAK